MHGRSHRTRRRPAPPRIVGGIVAIGLAAILGLRVGSPARAVLPDVLTGSKPAATGTLPGRAGDGPAPADHRPPVADAPRPVTSSVPPAASAPTVPVVPACTFADAAAPRAGYASWATTLVDTAFALPDGYVPPDLVPVGRAGIPGGGYVRSLVIDDLRALADGARDAGNPLEVQSAYRSRTRQAEVFAGWVSSSGETAARRFSARPGHSEHELGTALDLRAAAGAAPWSGSFASTAAGRWLAKHATEYGFVLSYPAGAESRTCYGAEAWHVRYVGRPIAAEVAASGLTLREWLWRFGDRR
jgi:zinc D-Ala-D-Ala carboxypeptidase